MKSVLKCDGLSKDWGNVHAVSEVTLDLPEAAVLAVVGPNGAGKSTWLQLVAGLVPPTSGEVWVDGISVQESTRKAHAKIGYLPDFYGINAQLTVREYLHYFALSYKLESELIPTRIDSVMANLNLAHLGDRPVSDLSRGQKQRVAIGRSLINNPRLLLLDEPAAGLDPGARIEFNELITQLAHQGMTIVVSSHILTELEDYSTHVAIFERGKLIRFEDLKHNTAKKTERRILCRFAQAAPAAEALFKKEGLSYKVSSSGAFELLVPYSLEESAALLKKLSQADLGLYHFEQLQTRIEDTYLETFKKGES